MNRNNLYTVNPLYNQQPTIDQDTGETTGGGSTTIIYQGGGGLTSVQKEKLDGIQEGAEVNQKAFSSVKINSTTPKIVQAATKTDVLNIAGDSPVIVDLSEDNIITFSLNEDVLNGIITDKINVLSFWKKDSKGNIYTEENAYSLKELSAYGIGEGGGSQGGAGALYECSDVLRDGDKVKGAANGTLLSYNGSHWHAIPQSDITPDLSGYVKINQIGVPNGIAPLDNNGFISSKYLPSYVDDVIEASTFNMLPAVGETGKIYVTTDTNRTYRWSGTGYIEISKSLALGYTDSTAFPGDEGLANTISITNLQNKIITFEDMFEWDKSKSSTDSTKWIIKAKRDFYGVGEVSAYGYADGEIPVGAMYMYELKDVLFTDLQSGQLLKWNGSRWVNIDANEVGLNETQLNEYLTQNNYAKKSDIPSMDGYATENWVTLQKYAKQSTQILPGNGITGGGDLSTDRTLSLSTIGTAGTYTKVTTDSYGRVISGGKINTSDVSGLQVALDGKLNITDFNKWFTIEYNTDGTIKRIKALYDFYSVGEVSAYGMGDTENPIGAMYLHELKDVLLTNIESGQLLKYNGTSWVNVNANEVGLNEEQLKQYLTDNNYATHSWVQGRGYLTEHQSLAGYAKEAWVTAKGYWIDDSTLRTKWDEAYTMRHSHANKGVLDGITATLITNWNNASTNSHTHANKAVIDGITTAKITNWDTAYSWGNHKSANYALQATSILAGTGLTGGGTLAANRTLSLGTVGIAGTYTKVTTDAYGRVSSGTTLSATDIPALAISKITGLQSTLDSKLNNSIFEDLFEKVNVGTSSVPKYAIKAKYDLFSTGEVSAYGAGEGNGGGSGLIQTVYGSRNLGGSFSDSTLTDTFNAFTINGIDTRLKSAEMQITPDAIRSTVKSQTESIAKDAVDELQIGGVNLIVRHNEREGWMIAGGTGEEQAYAPSSLMIDPIPVTPNESLVFQIVKRQTTADNFFRYAYFKEDGTLIVRKTSDKDVHVEVVPSGAAYLKVSYPRKGIVMLERGNKPTSWSASPEDTKAAIDKKFDKNGGVISGPVTVNSYLKLHTTQDAKLKFISQDADNYSLIDFCDSSEAVLAKFGFGGYRWLMQNYPLEVGGYVQATEFKKLGGNQSQLLRADGGVATFQWNGTAGQPTFVWGGESQHSYTIYNPSNFNVLSSKVLKGSNSENSSIKLDANSLILKNSIILQDRIAKDSSNLFPHTNNANGIISIGVHNDEFYHQLGFSSDRDIYHRDMYNNSWGNWRKMLTDSNWQSTIDGRYLPLTGGGLQGDLGVNGNIAVSKYIKIDGWLQNNKAEYGLFNSAENARWFASGGFWNSDKEIRVKGNLVWNSGNMGSTSGLDADLLDGQHLLNILPRGTYHYAEGTFVKTDILESEHAMCVARIFGNSYNINTGLPIDTTIQFYNYPTNDAILSPTAIHKGYDFGDIHIFNFEGKICLWFKQPRIYQSYFIEVYRSNSSTIIESSRNHVDTIRNIAKPTGTLREVVVTPKKSALITDNVSSATKLQTPRSIWGQQFDGTSNVNGNFATNGSIHSDVMLTLPQIKLLGQDVIINGRRAVVGGASELILNYGTEFPKTTVHGNMHLSGDVHSTSMHTSSWFRSTGNTGWYNTTYNGGMYMTDSTWIRTYNVKKLYVDNSEVDSIYTVGGVTSDKIVTNVLTSTVICSKGDTLAPDNNYGYINVTRKNNVDNAAAFSWIREGQIPFALGFNLQNQIVLGTGISSNKTIKPWLRIGSENLYANNIIATGNVTANSFYTGHNPNTTNSMSCSNWFRSGGDSGWLNDTHGGGIYMTDPTWVKIYNGKKFLVTNSEFDSISSEGGFRSYVNTSHSNIWLEILKPENAVFNCSEILHVNLNTYRNMIGWADQIIGSGYQTRYSIGSERKGAWGSIVLSVGNNDAGTSGYQLILGGNGNVDWNGHMNIANYLQVASVIKSIQGRLDLGDATLQYESSTNSIKVVKADGSACNFYATGEVSAYGAAQATAARMDVLEQTTYAQISSTELEILELRERIEELENRLNELES